MAFETQKARDARAVLADNNSRVKPDERQRAQNGETALTDAIISLKTTVSGETTVEILGQTTNKDAKHGIVDFDNQMIDGMNGEGTLVVQAMRIGHAVAADATVNPATLTFSPEAFPNHLEHAYIEFKQKDEVIYRQKISPFVRHGNAPEAIFDDVLVLGSPFILVGGQKTTITLKRPETGAFSAMSIDLIGMQIATSVKK